MVLSGPVEGFQQETDLNRSTTCYKEHPKARQNRKQGVRERGDGALRKERSQVLSTGQSALEGYTVSLRPRLGRLRVRNRGPLSS